jgi:hypothetical protein
MGLPLTINARPLNRPTFARDAVEASWLRRPGTDYGTAIGVGVRQALAIAEAPLERRSIYGITDVSIG